MKRFYVTSMKGFTLVEIAVAVAFLLIISSVAVVSYTNYISNAHETVCAENLDGLRNALMIYVSEKAALPTTLGELNPEQLKQGYDLAMQDADWKSKLAHSVLEFSLTSEAHAFSLSYEDLKAYGAGHEIFECPEDHNGGASYAINAEIAGLKWSEINANAILIAESDSYTFNNTSDLQLRHEGKTKALAITKNGRITKLDHLDDNDKVSICHNGTNTISVASPALEAHLAHGDIMGFCP